MIVVQQFQCKGVKLVKKKVNLVNKLEALSAERGRGVLLNCLCLSQLRSLTHQIRLVTKY